jgi:dTDP-4-dehydrorhamnose reductase
MKVLLYGKKGWIGQKVYDLLINEGHEVIVGSCRAENVKGLEDEITAFQPTNIISTIGRTHGTIGDVNYTTIDYLEQKGKVHENVRDNLYSPVMIAIMAQKHNIHYAYLGTGCIFNSNREEPMFTEEDLPNFFGSGYSTVKGFTDRLMHFFNDSVSKSYLN